MHWKQSKHEQSSSDQPNYGPNSKPLSAPPVFPPNDVFNPYRYMGGPHPPQMNATITSSVAMDIKAAMQYPSSAMSCKLSPESYTTSATMTTTTSSTPSTSAPISRPFDQMPPYIPKHWIWSRNLFYPHLGGNNHLLYSNSNGGFSGSDLSSPRGSTKTEVSQSVPTL